MSSGPSPCMTASRWGGFRPERSSSIRSAAARSGSWDRDTEGGAWTNADLRARRTAEIADVLGQPPALELMALYAQALRELGRFLGERSALGLVEQSGGSAPRLAELIGRGMTMWNDRGFYKRAQ